MNKITLLKSLASVLLIAALGFIASCGKEDEAPDPVSLEFATSAATLAENSGATFATVTITLAKAAAKDGTITIAYSEANAAYTTDFTTDPAGSGGEITLTVTKGATAAQFKIFAVNNSLLADDKAVEFTLSEVSDAFVIGAQDTYTLTLIDDEGPVTVNFTAASGSQAETNGTGTDVAVQLSAPAPGAGTISVTISSSTAVYTTNYTTTPAAATNVVTIPVAAGNQNLSFKITPVDDANVNAARELTFTITAASGVVNVGSAMITHTHTITDNETASTPTFNASSSSVGEDVSAGVVVPITLSPQTNGTGTLVIDLTGATYGTDFTTNPAAVNNQVTLNIATSATATSFTVIPANNSAVANNRTITFTLSSGTGIVVVGGSNNTHTVTIEEDDAITTIADVRALYPGTTAINSYVNITGIVTSSNPQVNTNNVWIQDNSGGIVVRFTAANNNTIARGDEVIVKLKGGTLASFNGLLQVEGVANANATIVDNGNTLPAPEVVTVTEAATGNYEGKLIRVNNVAFVDADGTTTMSGTKTISNGTNTISVRTETGASHATTAMPLGFGTVTGLAGEFNGAVQVIPIVFADDVFASSAVGSIGVTQAIANFGSVNNGAESASQSYTVQGTTLTQDITITASTGYKVSLDDTNFSSSATILAANANASSTVYVRFAPTTGVNQAINGTIVQKSLGAAPVSFSVSGTEAGNAVTTLVLNETFDYGASTGNLTTVSGGAWTAHSGAGALPVQYATTPLTMTDYPGSNVGGSITFAGGSGSREDVNRAFAAQSTGTIYFSALISMSTANATLDYFMHFRDNAGAFFGRLHAKDEGGVLKIGIQKTSGTGSAVNYSAGGFAYNTTYLVVVKHDFGANLTSLFVLNSVSGTEPTPDATEGGSATNPAQLSSVAVRQGGIVYSGTIDGIRVAQTWADLFN